MGTLEQGKMEGITGNKDSIQTGLLEEDRAEYVISSRDDEGTHAAFKDCLPFLPFPSYLS